MCIPLMNALPLILFRKLTKTSMLFRCLTSSFTYLLRAADPAYDKNRPSVYFRRILKQTVTRKNSHQSNCFLCRFKLQKKKKSKMVTGTRRLSMGTSSQSREWRHSQSLIYSQWMFAGAAQRTPYWAETHELHLQHKIKTANMWAVRQLHRIFFFFDYHQI